eukprot:SAG22_NODE_13086_length_419_cov_1.221875_1_plen_77_part_10
MAVRTTLLAAVISLATFPAPRSFALDNGLGRRPGLGWNSDYCTNCSGPLFGDGLAARSRGYGDEVFVKHIADHIHTV